VDVTTVSYDDFLNHELLQDSMKAQARLLKFKQDSETVQKIGWKPIACSIMVQVVVEWFAIMHTHILTAGTNDRGMV
jgi:hypothetical protein